MKAKPGDPVVLGKKFVGERFPTIARAPDNDDAELLSQFDEPEAIPLSVYFMNRRITDPVKQAMMTAFTLVHRATVAAFDKIFETF